MQDIDFSKTPQVVLLVGRPRVGKSNATKYLILKNTLDRKIFKFGICFTRTKFNKDYSFLPKSSVVAGYDASILKKYLSALEKKIEKGHKVPPNFVIFDDLIGLLSKHDPFLINFFGTHRHTNTSIFLCTQHLKTGANTTLREITSKAVLFNSKASNTLTSLYENFGQLFPNQDAFKEHFLKTTQKKHVAMLYNQDTERLEKNYWGYKCPAMGKYHQKLDFSAKKTHQRQQHDTYMF